MSSETYTREVSCLDLFTQIHLFYQSLFFYGFRSLLSACIYGSLNYDWLTENTDLTKIDSQSEDVGSKIDKQRKSLSLSRYQTRLIYRLVKQVSLDLTKIHEQSKYVELTKIEFQRESVKQTQLK